MIAFLDAAAILTLLALAFAALPPEALVPAVWLALTTPLLVRRDLVTRRLPNVLTVPGLGILVVSSVGSAAAESRVPDSLLTLATTAGVFTAGLLAARVGSLGMGDVKLAALLVGSLCQASGSALPTFGFITATAGIAAALAATRSTAGVAHSGRRATVIPFGPCLLLGYWSALLVAVVRSVLFV